MEMQGAAEDVLSKYSSQLQKQYEGHMAQKMGLQKYDKDLAVGLMSMMYEDETGIALKLKKLLLPRSLTQNLCCN